jgi:chromosomal replication initiation ATPase DnaA
MIDATNRKRRPETPEEKVKAARRACAEVWRLRDPATLDGKRGPREVTVPRHVSLYLVADGWYWTLEVIAAAAHCHHTQVMYAKKVVELRMSLECEKKFAAMVESARARMNDLMEGAR